MRMVRANYGALPAPPASTDDALTAALRQQADAGLDVVTDGQLTWPDPIGPLLAPLGGVRLGGAYELPFGIHVAQRPVVQAKLRRHGSTLVGAYRRAAALTGRPIKVVLTGPHTLSLAAEIATTAYSGPAALADDLSALLAQEITALVSAGVTLLQIEEPLLLADPSDAKRLRVLLEPLVDAAGDEARVIIATYGSDAGACYAQLNSLPGDVIAVDVAGPDRAAVCAAIAETGSGKPLALGIVDATGALEARDSLRARIDDLLRHYPHDELWLQPSRGLASLNAVRADAKLRLVASLA